MTNRRDTFYLLPLVKIVFMNRPAIVLIVVLIAVAAAFKFCNNKPETPDEKRQSPLSIDENTGTFNTSFNKLLGSYFALKDAFVASDTGRINAASREILMRSDSLQVNEIRGDSTGAIKETARSFTTTISSSAVAIAGENNIEGKRRELNMITDALWSLTRTVKFDGQKIYYQFCPMAFNNQGAYWLNNSREIRNPYFGSKMLTCGETADSVDYSKR
jgi:hypothetical protein